MRAIGIIATTVGLVVLGTAFCQCATAALPAPSWSVGDWWKYDLESKGWNGTGYMTDYVHTTLYYNITETGTKNVGGTDFTVFVAEIEYSGTWWHDSGSGPSGGPIEGGGSELTNVSDYATVQFVDWSNSTGTDFYWNNYSMLNYTPSNVVLKYPVNVGDDWAPQYTASGIYYDNMSMGPDTYNKVSVDYSPSYHCEKQETVGTYDCYLTNRQNDDGTQDMIEAADFAGNFVRSSENLNWFGIGAVQNMTLLGGHYNGHDLPAAPLVPQFAVILMPIAGLAAVFIIARRRIE